MAVLQTRAVVLLVRDHGDSDKIVTLYTEDRGKLAGIAKGAKRSRKRFVNKLEIFSLLDLYYAESRSSSLVRIDQAELVLPFPALRNDVPRYAAASLACELILHWTRENDPDKELFQLFTWALTKIDRGNPLPQTLIFFQIKMLGLLGFRPQLVSCCVCGAPAQNTLPFSFNPILNGLLCKKCLPGHDTLLLPLSMETIKLLLKAQDMEQDKLERLRFSPAATQEALTLLRYYGNHLLQREIESWNFLTPHLLPNQ